MHFATEDQKKTLTSQKLTYRFANVPGDKPLIHCDIIDTVTNESFVSGQGDNEAAALTKAIASLPDATRPSLSLVPEEVQAEIANLKKQLAEAKASKPDKK